MKALLQIHIGQTIDAVQAFTQITHQINGVSMSIPYPPSLPQAYAVMPRFWIGTSASCDVARRSLSFTCIEVNVVHTDDSRCHFIRILGSDGLVDYKAMAAVEAMVFANWPAGNNYLIHGPDGITLAPLTMALWLNRQQHVPMLEAYRWLQSLNPRIVNLSKLAVPQAGSL